MVRCYFDKRLRDRTRDWANEVPRRASPVRRYPKEEGKNA